MFRNVKKRKRSHYQTHQCRRHHHPGHRLSRGSGVERSSYEQHSTPSCLLPCRTVYRGSHQHPRCRDRCFHSDDVWLSADPERNMRKENVNVLQTRKCFKGKMYERVVCPGASQNEYKAITFVFGLNENINFMPPKSLTVIRDCP